MIPIVMKNAAKQIFHFTMVNADNTTKEQTEWSESVRHLVVKSV